MRLIARKHVRRCSAQAAPVTAPGGGNKQARVSVKYDCPSWLDNDPASDTGSQADGEGTRGNGGARGATCETWLL